MQASLPQMAEAHPFSIALEISFGPDEVYTLSLLMAEETSEASLGCWTIVSGALLSLQFPRRTGKSNSVAITELQPTKH